MILIRRETISKENILVLENYYYTLYLQMNRSYGWLSLLAVRKLPKSGLSPDKFESIFN